MLSKYEYMSEERDLQSINRCHIPVLLDVIKSVSVAKAGTCIQLDPHYMDTT